MAGRKEIPLSCYSIVFFMIAEVCKVFEIFVFCAAQPSEKYSILEIPLYFFLEIHRALFEVGIQNLCHVPNHQR